MNLLKSKGLYKKAVLFFVVLLFTYFSFSQTIDSTKSIGYFGGAVSVTNNGISLVPTFSLGKPAVIFDMVVGKRKLSFEPQLRFALNGKPWSFLFWWRYKLVQTSKFAMNAGAHYALNFKTITDSLNGVTKDVTLARRYLAAELFPRYLVAKNISVGMYYLYSHGIDPGTVKNTQFVTINSNFSNIGLSKQFFMGITPQFYYLKQDTRDGVYFSSAFSLAKRNFPVALSSIINKEIQTNILGSKDFVWNVTLIYSFNKKYVPIQ